MATAALSKGRMLTVVSPLIEGAWVRKVQQNLNWWAKRFDLDAITTDGQWGQDSRRLMRQVLFLMGATKAQYGDGFTVHEQALVAQRVEYPGLPKGISSAAQRRSRARRKAHTLKMAELRKGPGAIVREAERWVGITEHPAGENRGPHIDQWEAAAHMGRGPWCGAFAIHCARTAGYVVPDSWVYVPTILADARAGRYGRIIPIDEIRPGDLVIYNWDGGVVDHVGIAAEEQNKSSIEGNTSFDDHGDQSNGGAVAHKHRGRAGGALVCGVRLTKKVA